MGNVHSSRDREDGITGMATVNKTERTVSVSVSLSLDAGAGLVATKDLDDGEVIILLEKPFLSILQESALSERCSYCFKIPAVLRRCTGCNVANYCSSECQVASWKLDHKHECKQFRNCKLTQGRILPTPTRALTLALLSHKENELGWVSSLIGHEELFSQDTEISEANVLQALMAMKIAKLPNTSLALAIKINCQLKVNAFRLTAYDDTPIGICFDPVLAGANHSCLPNAVLSFDGRSTTLRALQRIKAGQEILISYIDPNLPKAERQHQLSSCYKFTCLCARCEQDMSVYNAFLKVSDDIIEENKMILSRGRDDLKFQALKSQENLETMDVCHVQILSRKFEKQSTRLDYCKEIERACHLNANNPIAGHPHPEMLHRFYDLYVASDNLAAATMIRLTLVYFVEPFQFPEPFHPVRVHSLFALAKLLHLTSYTPGYSLKKLAGLPINSVKRFRPEPTILSLVLLVQKLMRKSHGPESTFAREVRQAVEDATIEVRLRARNGQDAEFLAMLEDDFAPNTPGRELARDLWGHLQELAHPLMMLGVIRSIEVPGGKLANFLKISIDGVTHLA